MMTDRVLNARMSLDGASWTQDTSSSVVKCIAFAFLFERSISGD